MDDALRSSEAQLHATNMEQTLKELQRKVREHEAELQKIRSSNHDVADSLTAQANIIKAALVDVTDSEPFLPFPGSVLPALLALRQTHETIQSSQAYLAAHDADVEKQKRQLENDKTSLKDQRLLNDALNARIDSLRDELNSTAEMRPEDRLRARREELTKKKKNYDRETSKLMRVLLDFIDSHLASMLAAEELGGPVVGDLMDIDSEDLAAGFNAQGKLKKTKGDVNQDKRQRRIDDIWGGGDEGGAPESDETTSAGAEMRRLTEELLNRLVEAKGDNSAAYVELERESAAARFLVRSKVAQFHPKDAAKLKLVDFGRELDD